MTVHSEMECCRKLGAGLISANLSRHILSHLADKPGNYRPLVYCWRGGQRSRAMAAVLSQIGCGIHIIISVEAECHNYW